MTTTPAAEAARQRLADGPQFHCPACQRTLPMLVISDWGIEPVPCDIEPGGNLRLPADPPRTDAGHYVAAINGVPTPALRLVCHAARCPRNGLFAQFHRGPILLDEPGHAHPRPALITRALWSHGQTTGLLARCLLTGELLVLPDRGQRTGQQLTHRQLLERCGLDAHSPVKAPLIAACLAAHQTKALAPREVTARALIDAGLLPASIRTDEPPEFWWTQDIGEIALELRHDVPQMQSRGEVPDLPPDDPIDLLLAVWDWRVQQDSTWAHCSGIDTDAALGVQAAITPDQWRQRAGITDEAITAMRAAHDAEHERAQARLAAWRADGPAAVDASPHTHPIQMALC